MGLTSVVLSMCLPARPVSGVQQKRVKKALEEQEKAKQAYIEGEEEGHSPVMRGMRSRHSRAGR